MKMKMSETIRLHQFCLTFFRIQAKRFSLTYSPFWTKRKWATHIRLRRFCLNFFSVLSKKVFVHIFPFRTKTKRKWAAPIVSFLSSLVDKEERGWHDMDTVQCLLRQYKLPRQSCEKLLMKYILSSVNYGFGEIYFGLNHTKSFNSQQYAKKVGTLASPCRLSDFKSSSQVKAMSSVN